MADSSSSATPWLAFLVGGLVVVVAVIGFLVYSGQGPANTKTVDINVRPPAISPPAAPPAPAGNG